MTRTRTAVIALCGLLAAAAVQAGESEMLAPLPGLNVWSAGKTSFTLWGGVGKTNIGDGARSVVLDADGYPLLDASSTYLIYDEHSGTYDDRDWSVGGSYAFPVAGAITLEVGAHYGSGKSDTDPYSRDVDYLRQSYRVNVLGDEIKSKSYGLSIGGLYALSSGDASSIRGGLYFQAEGDRQKVDENLAVITQAFDLNIPGFGLDQAFSASGTSWEATDVTLRVGLTGDIHVVPEILRVTPTIGYYYTFTSIKTNRAAAYGFDETGTFYGGVEDLSTDSERGGGLTYGLELGYRPGGEHGKFEIVLTPVFKGRRVRIATGEKLDDHRNGIVLQFRMDL